MSEIVGAWLLFAGTLFTAVGFVWLLIKAFKTGIAWGLAGILTFPIGLLLFGILHLAHARRPMILLALGIVLGGVPFVADAAHQAIWGLGERERMINGERHLVLTGWDRPDYAILQEKPDVVVLEMANPDVTDATLAMLVNLPQIRELTLNDSLVTDTGLASLRKLSELESLRLARTKVTTRGIQDFLSDPPPNLKNLDVSGNEIPASALRKWKNADPQNRRYLN